MNPAQVVTTAADVSRLGTILSIWAHPDDEVYLSGGLMAAARDAGSRVVCVTATRGGLGTSDPETWPPQRLAALRTDELAQCLAVLGVTEHHWLDLPDGGCAELPTAERAAALDRLTALIEQVAPDTVLTFGPDGITGHPDHRAVSAWVTAAFDRTAAPGARLLHAAVSDRHAARWREVDERLGVYLPGYPTTVPTDELAVDAVLDGELLACKVRALQAQASQTTWLIDSLGLDVYTAWVEDEAFRNVIPNAS